MEIILNVKTILRTDKKRKDNTYPLYLSFSLHGKPYRLSTGLSLKLDQWDKNGNKVNKKHHKWRNLNALLKKYESNIDNFVADLRIKGMVVDFQKIKCHHAIKMERKSALNQDDFYHHYDRFTEKKFLKISSGTQNHYLLLRKQLLAYQKNLKLTDLTYSFFNDFFHYLETVEGIGESGLAMRRKNLITTLEEFKRLKLINDNNCKLIPRFKEKERDEFLTPEDLTAVTKLNLQFGLKTYGLNLSRDLFLFASYTGLRFSDVMNLNHTNVKGRRIEMIVSKTSKSIEIPINDKAMEILKKYDYRKKKKETIFPFRTNVSVNRDLKLIAKMAKIKRRVSFHTSRHTFGSILAMNGVNPFDIKELMGHADVRMTNRYVNTNYKILENVMSKVNFHTA